MEKQQFLEKFEKLKSPVNAEMWAFLDLLLHNGKSKKEIAKALDVDISTVSRRLTRVCKHFDIRVERGGLHEDDLVNLFRVYIPDFLHSSIRHGVVDNELLISPQPSTNAQNIPTLEPIQELTTLEFIGREKDITNLANLSKQTKIGLIKAGAGAGKSRLAKHFLEMHFEKVIEINIGLSSGEITTPSNILKQILSEDLDKQPSEDFGVNLRILRITLSSRKNPIGILVDKLEPALDKNFGFHENWGGYEDLLEVLGDPRVNTFTLITSRISLISLRVSVPHYLLEGLDIKSWKQYFNDCKNVENSQSLVQMHESYNGNARIMNILYNEIKNIKTFNGNIESYWNRYKGSLLDNMEIVTLISAEINWLRDSQPDAHKLFYQISSSISQDIKSFSFDELLHLLQDMPESKRGSVIDCLSRTSLIERKDKDCYYLSPVIHKAAQLYLPENISLFSDLNLSLANASNNIKMSDLEDIISQTLTENQNIATSYSNPFLATPKDRIDLLQAVEANWSVGIFPQMTSVIPVDFSIAKNSELQSSQILGISIPTNTNYLADINQKNSFDLITTNSQTTFMFNPNYVK